MCQLAVEPRTALTFYRCFDINDTIVQRKYACHVTTQARGFHCLGLGTSRMPFYAPSTSIPLDTRRISLTSPLLLTYCSDYLGSCVFISVLPKDSPPK